MSPSPLSKNVRVVVVDHRIAETVRVTRIDVLTTIKIGRIKSRTIDRVIGRIIDAPKKAVSLVRTSRMKTGKVRTSRRKISKVRTSGR